MMALCRKWYASNRPPGQLLQEPDVLLQKDIPSKKVVAGHKAEAGIATSAAGACSMRLVQTVLSKLRTSPRRNTVSLCKLQDGPPDNFLVLLLHPSEVDYVELSHDIR